MLTPSLALVLLAQAPTVQAETPQPAPASAPSAVSQPASVVQARLSRAVAWYQRSEFSRARHLLEQLAKQVRDDRSRQAQQVYTYLAFVQIAFGETERAVETFERALSLRAGLELADVSPKIARVFAQARRRYRAKVRALDHDAPRLRHDPVATASYGDTMLVEVEVKDVVPVERVSLFYRRQGTRGYGSVSMERRAAGQYVASIPGFAVAAPAVEYYIAAWDAIGNGPGLKGSAQAPISVTVSGGPPAPGKAGPKPWYTNWWVWAVVATTALAAGGVAAGVYLGRDERARIDLRLDPALDPVGMAP
jgi:tetratricopeptide (TPR) repeat protein